MSIIERAPGAEKVIPTVCNSHCGGACLLKVHVKDGTITRIETDDGEEPQFRACLKGRAYRQRVYAPDRLRFPMKRVGLRGEGKFERISWDEALDTVATELRRVKGTYGPESILYWTAGGDLGVLHGSGDPVDRLLCLTGGFSAVWGIYSYEAAVFAELANYGTAYTFTPRDDLLNSRLIVMWGWDPANSRACSNTDWYLAQAKEAGIRIVSVDPRYTDSTAIFADQWIPIRPGTDTAMLVAMAYVMITEELQDQKFLDTYTVGFDKFKDYVLGEEDGVPKTPQWAEAITGVPAATIAALAREYATTKPAALIAGISPGRTACGEQYHRVAITLTAMTGNIGVPGGSCAGKTYGGIGPPFFKLGRGLKIGPNPVEDGAPPSKDKLPGRLKAFRGVGKVNKFNFADAVLKGKAGGYPVEYKLLFLVANNFVNQSSNINRTAQALKRLEFIVVEEQFMTPTARFADILLPVNSFLERNDLCTGPATPPFYGYKHKVIDSLDESRSQLEIAEVLAKRLGITDFNDRTEEQLLEQVLQGSDIPDHEAFKEQAIFRIKLPEPYVAFRKQIEDPERNPFPTPSGKIEIYSQQIADMHNPLLPPIPKYIEPWEIPTDPLAKKYPLQLITTHYRLRAHSQFYNIPWLRELEPEAITMSVLDAQERGIRDGELVRVFNDRGEMLIPARVTERITPGVVEIHQGAWYKPDERGIDRGGSANVLTRDEPSPGGAFVSNTCLVQVQKG
ncbi:MAG: molybdopterin-dependent oxidoreductase [Chloroflexi bacterium]|nr:molybdopterin-dependent oxidoreductase [Chloroflexota bacterium]